MTARSSTAGDLSLEQAGGGAVHYIDLVVDKCLSKGRVVFKNAKHMGRILQLEDFPTFVFDDWLEQKLLVPENQLLGEHAIVRGVPGAGDLQKASVDGVGSIGQYLLPTGEWVYAGAKWTADTTVGWGRWIFKMGGENSSATAGAGDDTTPLTARTDDGTPRPPAMTAEERREKFQDFVDHTNESFGVSSSADSIRYVFVPALDPLAGKINHHIVFQLPMLDTVLTCEEWGDLLLDLTVMDGPVITSHLLAQQPPRFIELAEWIPPSSSQPEDDRSTTTGGEDDPSSLNSKSSKNGSSGSILRLATTSGKKEEEIKQNQGGMLFSTSDHPEMEAAAVILFAKRLSEKMTTFIRTHEYKLAEATEFAKDTTEDSQERLTLSKSEKLLEVNKLFHLQLSKTLKRLKEQRTLSVQEIAEAIDEDCLEHFPGTWPRETIGEDEVFI